MNIVFINGFLANSKTWDKVINNLNHSDKTKCYFIEFPNELYLSLNLLEISNYIAIKINNLNLKNIVLVGHSIGGLYAILYTKSYQKNIKKLILVDPSFHHEFSDECLMEELSKVLSEFKKKVYTLWMKHKSEQLIQNELSSSIDFHIPVIIHHNILKNSKTVFEDFDIMRKMTIYNVKSKIVAYYDYIHMIHQKRHQHIVESIL